MTRRRERGSVLVETALIVATALTLMLFTVDVGLLGIAQVSADGAAFFDAHENVIGVQSGTPESNVASMFPYIGTSNMSTTVVAAPTPNVQVDYGYNETTGAAPPGSASQRYGGASMMQPVQLQVTVSPQPFFNIAGQSVGVSSQFIEPKWTECGPHYNVANENYACGDPSAPPNSAVAPSDAEYTPPYYVGYNLMLHCQDAEPWGDPVNGTETACQTTNFLALGMSSYLDTNNWNNPNPGVSGTYGSSTFHAAAFHQRVYANIAQFLATYPTLFALYQDYSKSIYNQLGVTSFSSTPTKTFNNNQTWSGFLVPNNFLNVFRYDPNGIDEAIQCVYNWDDIITSGFAPGTYQQPGDAPLSPEHQCAGNVTL